MTFDGKIVLSFSGDKDSVLSLYELLQSHTKDDIILLTTLDTQKRVLFHNIDAPLLEAQAMALRLRLTQLEIPATQGEKSFYAESFKQALHTLQKEGAATVAYGDIYLQDVRQYRENELAVPNLNTLYPLWGKDPKALAQRFLELGFKAIIACVHTKVLSKAWIGKAFDQTFIDHLIQANLEPCGENGEFHTFVYDGPLFNQPVQFKIDLEHPSLHNAFYTCATSKKE